MKRLRQRYIVTYKAEVSGIAPTMPASTEFYMPVPESSPDCSYYASEYDGGGFNYYYDTQPVQTTYLHDGLHTPKEAKKYCRKSFNRMKRNCVLLAEVAAILNQQYWEYYDRGQEKEAAAYEKLYYKTYNYGMNNFEGEELKEFKYMLEYEDEDQFNDFW